MINKPELIIGEDKIAGLNKVLSIYGEITGNKKLYNDAVESKIKAHLAILKGDVFFN